MDFCQVVFLLLCGNVHSVSGPCFPPAPLLPSLWSSTGSPRDPLRAHPVRGPLSAHPWFSPRSHRPCFYSVHPVALSALSMFFSRFTRPWFSTRSPRGPLRTHSVRGPLRAHPVVLYAFTPSVAFSLLTQWSSTRSSRHCFFRMLYLKQNVFVLKL